MEVCDSSCSAANDSGDTIIHKNSNSPKVSYISRAFFGLYAWFLWILACRIMKKKEKAAESIEKEHTRPWNKCLLAKVLSHEISNSYWSNIRESTTTKDEIHTHRCIFFIVVAIEYSFQRPSLCALIQWFVNRLDLAAHDFEKKKD